MKIITKILLRGNTCLWGGNIILSEDEKALLNELFQNYYRYLLYTSFKIYGYKKITGGEKLVTHCKLTIWIV